jgi:orotate phosphoribosyltransferase
VFVVRKKTKEHGHQQLIEGPLLDPSDRCLIVDDVVTTGASTIKAIKAIQGQGHQICGVLAVLDRLAGGAEAIEAEAQAPFVALTTIDDVYPERPDREAC